MSFGWRPAFVLPTLVKLFLLGGDPTACGSPSLLIPSWVGEDWPDEDWGLEGLTGFKLEVIVVGKETQGSWLLTLARGAVARVKRKNGPSYFESLSICGYNWVFFSVYKYLPHVVSS